MASADATHIPNEHHRVRLNTGDGMPTIGWGTYMINSDEIGSCIDYAIEAGYRHIDTAFAYDNEMAIGAGLQRLKKLGKVTRRELFITSKLWNTFHRPELVRPAFMQSLKYLQLDYLDLYLMHTPCAFALDVEHPGDMYPRHRDQTIRFDNTSDYVNTWLEMKKLFDDGLVRNIGVANLNIDQLKRIIATGTVPAVLQIECNPFCVQNDLWQFCAAHDIHVSAHSPLGAPSRLIGFDGVPKLLDNCVVHEIAATHCKSPAQILIRYQMQLGHGVVCKSVRPEHIRSNIDVFDFCLTAGDMQRLNSLDVNVRCCPYLESVSHLVLVFFFFLQL